MFIKTFPKRLQLWEQITIQQNYDHKIENKVLLKVYMKFEL